MNPDMMNAAEAHRGIIGMQLCHTRVGLSESLKHERLSGDGHMCNNMSHNNMWRNNWYAAVPYPGGAVALSPQTKDKGAVTLRQSPSSQKVARSLILQYN